MKIDFELKEFPKPKSGTLMTTVWREMFEHYNNEFKRLAETIIKAIEDSKVEEK